MKNLGLSKLCIVILPRLSMGGFLICITIAMFLYKGGIYHMVLENGLSQCPGSICTDAGHSTTGYLFNKNFLSDLGRTITHGGHINYHASLLFNMALTFGGITYILFYFFLKNLFQNQMLAKVGSLVGIFGAISFIGVAFTPADLYLDAHIIANEWIFRFFLLSTIIYSWLMYKTVEINNKYLIGNLIFIISLLIYILILQYGPKPYEPGGLVFQAISQKFIMFNFFISIIIQTMAYNKMIRKN